MLWYKLFASTSQPTICRKRLENDYEVKDAALEMKSLWGPNRPGFIAQASNSIAELAHSSIARACGCRDGYDHVSVTDDSILRRQEIAEYLTHGL